MDTGTVYERSDRLEELTQRVGQPEVRRLLIRIAWPRMLDAERTLAWFDWQRTH